MGDHAQHHGDGQGAHDVRHDGAGFAEILDDEQRAANLLEGVKGKRLTYRTTDSGAE